MSSVLFDGSISELTGLDGNMWANQHYVTRSNITFDFTDTMNYTGVRRIEIVVLNCEQLGSSVQTITLSSNDIHITDISVNVTSCYSFVRVCIPHLMISCDVTTLSLNFLPVNAFDWVHIAEVTFSEGNHDCPTNAIIDTPTMPTPVESECWIQQVLRFPMRWNLQDWPFCLKLRDCPLFRHYK